LWSSLPAWLQLDIENGRSGNASYVRDEDGTDYRDITIVTPLGASGDVRFELCLKSLDDHGFDPSAVLRPSHSYYASLAVNGTYRYVHICADSGEKAVVGIHNNSWDPILFVRYIPGFRQIPESSGC